MSSEEQAKRFINTLKDLGGSAGNGSLSAELGWADSTYQRIKARLIEEGRIVPGRGRGGSSVVRPSKIVFSCVSGYFISLWLLRDLIGDCLHLRRALGLVDWT